MSYEYKLAMKAKKDPKLIYSYINSKREIKEDQERSSLLIGLFPYGMICCRCEGRA